MKAQAITIPRPRTAELGPVDASGPLGSSEVRGPTLVSLVSPGTEVHCNFLGTRGRFPNTPGYAAVFEAQEIGCEVRGIKPGDQLFCMGGHRSIQQHPSDTVVPVPAGLSPQEATLARLMGVTMTTLRTTTARPGDVVLVTGVGPVGYLGAHLFRAAGYAVVLVDPDPRRQEIARQSGLSDVFASVPLDGGIKGKVGLALDCSGHEQAVLDCMQAVRRKGEVVLVGVPWERRTDLSANQILDAVFYNYVILRSGWEWELPVHAADFRPHSMFSGYELALGWLAEGRIPSAGLFAWHRPEDAQSVYQGLLDRRMEGLFQVFDWQDRTAHSAG